MRHSIYFSIGVALATFGVSANAQVETSSEGHVELEAVTVTAQKRAENLQSVPLALSAYSGDLMQDQNISTLTDLKVRVPSLIYDEYSAGQPRFYIRGIGNNIQSGAVDEDVGVFVDGVYMGRPEMTNVDFINLERVEILRGPQGTLFGRNVVGGAISFISKVPTDQFEAGTSVTYGDYDQMGASGYVSGALSDRVYASLAGTWNKRDGYNYNLTTNNDVEDTRLGAIKSILRFVPSDTLDVRIYLDAAERRGTGGWSVPFDRPPAFVDPQRDPRRAAHFNDDGYADIDNRGVSLNIDWETNLGTFTSISAYRNNEMNVRFRVAGTIPAEPVSQQDYFIQQYFTDSDQFTQEFRLASPVDNRLTWVAGLYFLRQDIDYNSTDDFRFLCCGQDAFVSYDSTTKVDSYAAFANLKFDFTDSFSVQGGLRYSHDKKQTDFTASGQPAFSVLTIDGVPAPDGWSTSNEKTWDDVTPTVSLNYSLAQDKFLYATASRGFKSGGFSKGNDEMRSAEVPFNPEYAWNYELGAKTEWLDSRLRFNIAAFYIDYTDLQLRILVQVLPPPGQPSEIVANAGKTNSKGIETEWTFIATPDFQLYGSYTYLDTEIEEMVLNGVDQAGHRLAKTPEHKLFVGSTYSWAISSALRATARIDYGYESEYHSNPTNNPVEKVPSQGVLGAGLLFQESDSGNWTVELWGKNLTDEYHPSQITDVQGVGWAVPLDPPRTYGVTVRYDF